MQTIHINVNTIDLKVKKGATILEAVRDAQFPFLDLKIPTLYYLKGICDIDMTTAKDLKGTECCKVTSANYNTYGANPHIKVGGV